MRDKKPGMVSRGTGKQLEQVKRERVLSGVKWLDEILEGGMKKKSKLSFSPKVWECDCGKYGWFSIQKSSESIKHPCFMVMWVNGRPYGEDSLFRAVKKSYPKIVEATRFDTYEECVSWCEEALVKIKEVLNE